MPKRVRLCAIFQLCFTCSWFLLLLLSPFTGDYWTTRASLLLFETATGVGEGRFIPQEKLLRHQERFQKLPQAQQAFILEGYHRLEQEAQASPSKRFQMALYLLTHQEAPFLPAWFLAGLILPVLLLLRKEGSVYAIWLLPIIAACYLVSHFFYSSLSPLSADAKLFPTEVELHAYESPALAASSEYARLQDAWNRYLFTHWDPQSTHDLEEAEYQFNLARVMAKTGADQEKKSLLSYPNTFPQRSSLFLAFFFLWHFFFALTVQRAHHALLKEQKRLQSPLLANTHGPAHPSLI